MSFATFDLVSRVQQLGLLPRNPHRYYQRLKQHQDRQRKFIEQAKIKHLAEWRQRMATVFPSFGMQEQLKQFDEARGGGNLSKLKELLRTDDESQ